MLIIGRTTYGRFREKTKRRLNWNQMELFHFKWNSIYVQVNFALEFKKEIRVLPFEPVMFRLSEMSFKVT